MQLLPSVSPVFEVYLNVLLLFVFEVLLLILFVKIVLIPKIFLKLDIDEQLVILVDKPSYKSLIQ